MSVFFRRRGKASVLDDTFANNSWEAIIAACQSGNVPASWAVGDSNTMPINGASYQVDIIGKNHDTYTARGTAPLTFQLHDCSRLLRNRVQHERLQHQRRQRLDWRGLRLLFLKEVHYAMFTINPR